MDALPGAIQTNVEFAECASDGGSDAWVRGHDLPRPTVLGRGEVPLVFQQGN